MAPTDRIRLALSALLLLSACSKTGEFLSAQHQEKLGRYPSAIRQYESFAILNSRHPRAPEALFRIGEIYRGVVDNQEKARGYYQRVMDGYPKSAWAEKAEQAFMDCPDYFPSAPGLRRSLGDAQSGGKYMQIMETVEGAGGPKFKVKKEVRAGKQMVSSSEVTYEEKDRELREYQPKGDYLSLLRYPAVKGAAWETLQGDRRLRLTIEDDKAAVETKAGVFIHCLKVRQEAEGSGSTWKYTYYAPGVGPVLASVATANTETRIIELLALERLQEIADGGTKKPSGKWRSWLRAKFARDPSSETPPPAR